MASALGSSCPGKTKEVLGHCGLRRWPDTEDVEILYAIEPRSWRRGYATEAATASLQVGFPELGLDRIIAAALPENIASVRILRKLGMRMFEERDFSGLHVLMFELDRARWDATQSGSVARARSAPDHTES